MAQTKFKIFGEMIPSGLKDVDKSFKHIVEDMHLKDKELLPDGNKQ